MKLYIITTILIFIKGGDSLSTVSILPALCGTTADRSSGGILKAHAGVDEGDGIYSPRVLNCRYTIQATTAEHKLRFNVGTGMGEVNGIFHDLGCVGARMNIVDSDGLTRLAQLCGGVIDRTEYLSSRDTLVLEIISFGGNDTVMNFTAQYTSFLDSANCTDDASLFPCSNGRCVSREGQCDVTLINNCGDFSDNSRGPPGNCSSEEPPETTFVETTVAITSAAAPSNVDQEENLLWVAGIVIGLMGSYFLYWLLWKPGYLVWRCSCWRHLSCCKSCLSKNPSSLGQADLIPKQPPANDGFSSDKFDGGSDETQQPEYDESGDNNLSSEKLESNFEKDITNGRGPLELRPNRVYPAPEPFFGIQRESHFFST